MDINELKEMNSEVIRIAHEVARPYKITTLILATLLVGMIGLYFLCPGEYSLNQENTETDSSVNYNG